VGVIVKSLAGVDGSKVGFIVSDVHLIEGSKVGFIVDIAVVEGPLLSEVKIMSYMTMIERLTSATSRTSPEETSNSVVLRPIEFMLSISMPFTRRRT